MAPCAYGTSAKHGEKYGGVFGKARYTFCHVFNLGITTLSNIATKLSFGCGAADAVLSQSLIGLRAAMSLTLPARRCYQSSRD